MRSIEGRYEKFTDENLSTFIKFCKAVKYQNFGHDRIRRSFNRLVDCSDYQKKDKLKLFVHLYNLTKKCRLSLEKP